MPIIRVGVESAHSPQPCVSRVNILTTIRLMTQLVFILIISAFQGKNYFRKSLLLKNHFLVVASISVSSTIRLFICPLDELTLFLPGPGTEVELLPLICSFLLDYTLGN